MSNPLPSDSVSEHRLPHKITAEALGTGFLVAAVVGSGIMAAKTSRRKPGARAPLQYDSDRSDPCRVDHRVRRYFGRAL